MDVRATRNVPLTPEREAFLDGRVASGRYRSASEVVRAALRLPRREGPASDRPARGGARKAPRKAGSDG